MKKLLCVLFAAILTLSAVLLTGCDDKKKNNSRTKTTETASQTKVKSDSKNNNKSEIESYIATFIEGDSDFYGVWQPTTFDYINIVFRNDNLAEMITGSEGYFSKYNLDEKAKTIELKLMPDVIDGEYNYDFSDDKQELTLSLGNNKLALVKQKDFTIVPKPPQKPMIDSDILGWWENEDGMFYCFQKDGIMYENSISMETCYTYTVEDNKIKATYSMGGDMTDEFTYSVKNGELTLNGSKCKRKK